MSVWSLHPLRMAIIFSFSSQRSQYSFQLRSPFWTVYQNLPLLLPWPIAHWVLSEYSILHLVIIMVGGLFVISTLRNGLGSAFTKQTISRFIIDQSFYQSYFIIYLCFRDRPFATQLNMVLIYFAIHHFLVSTVDPTCLLRAQAYYCGDIPQAEPVHNLVQIQSSHYF